MNTVNIHKAKTHLSRLVEEAANGQPFIIAKAGKPMVQVTPILPPQVKVMQRIGFMKGQIRVPDNFDTMLQDEIIGMFEGTAD